VFLGGRLAVKPVLTPGSIAAQYDDIDRVVSWAGDTYSYDADGNLNSVTGTRALAADYDAFNRLISVQRQGTNSVFQYDGLGNRVQTTVGTRVRKFHYDHLGRLLFETDGANVLTAQYVYRGHALMAMWASGEGWHFYHFDQVGSTLALTDQAGAISAAYRYRPYGELSGAFTRVENPFTFVGKHGVMDDGGGLYLMGARHYDAVTGRFLQRDPIGFAGGWNLYAYVGGNPVERLDPSGMVDAYDSLESVGTLADEMTIEQMRELAKRSLRIITGAAQRDQRAHERDEALMLDSNTAEDTALTGVNGAAFIDVWLYPQASTGALTTVVNMAEEFARRRQAEADEALEAKRNRTRTPEEWAQMQQEFENTDCGFGAPTLPGHGPVSFVDELFPPTGQD
jgi:RHS repeat-associated protein